MASNVQCLEVNRDQLLYWANIAKINRFNKFTFFKFQHNIQILFKVLPRATWLAVL